MVESPQRGWLDGVRSDDDLFMSISSAVDYPTCAGRWVGFGITQEAVNCQSYWKCP